MKILRNLVIPAAAAAALILPAGVLAQQATAPNQNPPAAGQWQGHGGHRGGFMRMFRNLNLSAQQKSKIQQIVQQYHQAHPQGSQPNPQARKQMRDQIMNLLTLQQRTTSSARFPKGVSRTFITSIPAACAAAMPCELSSTTRQRSASKFKRRAASK